MSWPSWQRYRTGCRRSPVRTLPHRRPRMLASVMGVTWDAVPEQSWLSKLRRTPALKTYVTFSAGTPDIGTSVGPGRQGSPGPAGEPTTLTVDATLTRVTGKRACGSHVTARARPVSLNDSPGPCSSPCMSGGPHPSQGCTDAAVALQKPEIDFFNPSSFSSGRDPGPRPAATAQFSPRPCRGGKKNNLFVFCTYSTSRVMQVAA